MIDTILFDLDGTLLPMDIDVFIKHYFVELATYCARWGYEPELLIDSLKKSTIKMLHHDGLKTNEQVFWDSWIKDLGPSMLQRKDDLETFYLTDFIKAKEGTKVEPLAKELIRYLKGKGYRLIVATNPMFPKVASKQRVKWAGLDPNDFEEITTYEDYHYTKPNVKYYEEIFDKFGLKPDQCFMIGNDALEDLAIAQLGVDGYLVTDYLINRENVDLSTIRTGQFSEMVQWVKENL